MMQEVKKHSNLVPAKEDLLNDVRLLHWSCNPKEFALKWTEFSRQYNKKSTKDFLEYFQAQWIDTAFNRWRIFDSVPGFPNTNNSLESFNNQIK